MVRLNIKNMNKHAQALGKLGGQKSAKSRFKGKTKEEISEQMKKIRWSKVEWTKQDTLKSKKMAQELNDNLNKTVSSDPN